MKEFKQAVYNDSNNELWQGNPLIESLPVLLDEESVIRKTLLDLNITESQRLLPDRERSMMVSNLKYVFYPLNEHIELYYTIMELIASGYVSRNPINYENLKLHRENIGIHHFSSTALIGISGTGKTTTVEKILSLVPQVCEHRNYKGIKYYGKQVNWLKVDCPYDGGMGGFCRAAFKAVDDLLGTNYLLDLGGERTSVSTMVSSISKIFMDINLGLLVVDEFQHILNYSWKKDLNNFLTSFPNNAKVPIFVIGTPKAEDAFEEAFRATRRYVDDGAHYWNRILSPDDPKWKEWFPWLFEFQYTKTRTALTEEISRKFYDYSQGIFAIASSLFRKVQSYVISNPADQDEIITPEVIDYVFKAYYKPLVKVVDAIKNNDYEELEKLEDLLIKVDRASFTHYRVKLVNPTAEIESRVEANRITKESFKTELVTVLENMDCPVSRKTAEALVNDVIDKNPGETQKELWLKVMQEVVQLVMEQKEEDIGFTE